MTHPQPSPYQGEGNKRGSALALPLLELLLNTNLVNFATGKNTKNESNVHRLDNHR